MEHRIVIITLVSSNKHHLCLVTIIFVGKMLLYVLFGQLRAQCRESVEIKCHSCHDNYLGEAEQQIFILRFGRLECEDYQESALLESRLCKSAKFNCPVITQVHSSSKLKHSVTYLIAVSKTRRDGKTLNVLH